VLEKQVLHKNLYLFAGELRDTLKVQKGIMWREILCLQWVVVPWEERWN